METSELEVLIVEDEANLREQIGKLVEMWGYQVRYAHDVASAQAELERKSADIVLTDLMLLDQPSYQLMQWCQNHRPPLPVLVMTAYASLEHAVEALKRGAYDFLLKPITPAELEAALTRASVAVGFQREHDRAEHLRHIAEVALTLAHEINNPLAVMMGQVQLQLEERGAPIDRRVLEICLVSSQRIADVVRKILSLQDVAYQEFGGMRLIDLDLGQPPKQDSRTS